MTRGPQLLLLLLRASLVAWASDAAPEDAALLQVSDGRGGPLIQEGGEADAATALSRLATDAAGAPPITCPSNSRMAFTGPKFSSTHQANCCESANVAHMWYTYQIQDGTVSNACTQHGLSFKRKEGNSNIGGYMCCGAPAPATPAVTCSKGTGCGKYKTFFDGLQAKGGYWLWNNYYFKADVFTADKCGEACESSSGCKSFTFEEYFGNHPHKGTTWCYLYFDTDANCQSACKDPAVNQVCKRENAPSNAPKACGVGGNPGGSYGFKKSSDLCTHTGGNAICGNFNHPPKFWLDINVAQKDFAAGQSLCSCLPELA